MTDLTFKFNDLKALMSSNHIHVMEALNQILAKLDLIQNPPSGGTEDILEALQLIDSHIQSIGLAQQGTNTQLGQIGGLISTSNSLLGPLATSANSILQFMLTNDWCCTGGTGDPITPPLSTVPSVNEEERCQKAQVVSDVWVALIDRFDVLISQTGPTTNQQVYHEYDLNALVSAPKPSQSELSTLAYAINGARSAGLSNLGGLAFSFKVSLQNVLYTADNAQSARQELISWSNAHFNDPFTRDIMAFTINNGLLNLVYQDGGRELDTTGYDGFICDQVTASCMSQTSIAGVAATPSNGYSPRHQAVFPGMAVVDTIEYGPGLFASYSQPVVMVDGFQGGTIYYKVGRARVVYGNAGQNTHFESVSTQGSKVEIPFGADYLIIDDFLGENTPGTGPFEVTFCSSSGEPI